MRLHILLVCLAAPALTACDGGDCISIGYPALNIAIIDGRSGAPNAGGATVIVIGTAFSDSVRFPPNADTWHYQAIEGDAGPGFYAITIQKPGYETWRKGVRVRSASCGHVHTESLTAALTPIR